jgi:2-polyprenyl-3-methyl-5-hydroxy-6-metoxy-1,4-benzoquinol methylase
MTTPGYRPLEWNDALVDRFWRWEANFPEHYFTRQFGAQIAQRLQPILHGRRKVLDYGCGVGYLVRHLVALGHEVTATDHSEAGVEATNALNHDLADFSGAVLPDALISSGRRFDAIVSIEVVEHLSDSHLAQFFATLRQLLAPGGIAIITTPNDEDLRAAETYCPCCEHVFHRWQHLRSWTASSLTAAIEGYGLVATASFTTNFAYRPLRDPVGCAKRIAKRLLGREIKEPHLVCIARAHR